MRIDLERFECLLSKRGLTHQGLADALDVDVREVRRLINTTDLVIDRRHLLVLLVRISDYLEVKPFEIVKARTPSSDLHVISGSDVDEAVLRQTCELDQLAYPAGTEGTPEIGRRWLAQDPNAIVVVQVGDIVVGYLTSLPVSEATISALMQGTLLDLELGLRGEIEHVNDGLLYVVSALLDKRFKRQTEAFRCLLNGFLNSLRRRARAGHQVHRIVAEAVAPHGPPLCKTLRMAPLGKSIRQTWFYGLDLRHATTRTGDKMARAARDAR